MNDLAYRIEKILGFDPQEMFGDEWDTDWRIAGAMMEKCFRDIDANGRRCVGFIESNYASFIYDYTPNGEAISASVDNYESLPRAINEACCEALEE